MSELLWIAVPGGITDRAGTRVARLSIAIMPRLDGSSLAGEGLSQWPPPALTAATLAVDFARTPEDDEDTMTVVEVAPPHIRPQAGVWDAFFARIPVRPRRPVRGDAPAIEVDATARHAQAVESTFNECARAEMSEDASPDLSKEVRRQLEARWTGDPAAPATAAAAPTPVPPDFHQAIAWLREHPTVLRSLGLVIDLTFPATAIPAGLAKPIVRVRWPGAPRPPALPEIVSPWSRYDREFFPGSTTNVSAGMVTLTDDRVPLPPEPARRWTVATVDVDGAAARLRNAARSLATPSERDRRNDVDTVMLPALRTAGLMLLRRGRADDFAIRRAAADRHATRTSMAGAVLDADDLILGYRLDVSTFGSTEWLSLQERLATYTVGALTIGDRNSPEEGHLKAHAALADGAGSMRADEVVARWDGWSLAVKQPTFGIGNGGRRERRRDMPFEFDFSFSVPRGSLPKLRFTKRYRLRARVADLTGGGLQLTDPAADRCTIENLPFRRYEPVASPAVSLPAGVVDSALGPAESVDVVVIRSDAGRSVAEFAADNPRYAIHSRRVLSPPRASLATAERHELLDNLAPERTFELLQRTAARDGDAEHALPDPASGGIAAFPRSEPGRPALATRADRLWSRAWPDFETKQLDLREGVPEGSAPIAWQGDHLVIKLAKAEHVTIELSSFLRENFFDQFAMSVVPELPATSQNLAEVGRHPMITPARPVTFVHAVRRPLKEPHGKLMPHRAPGDTSALLVPVPARLEVDTNSTAQVDITASWSERRDDQPVETVRAPVQSVIVHRGDDALRDAIRQEFGDTRHRAVTYTVTAVSRFRQYFDDREAPSAFLAETTLAGPVIVPSTARPAPPAVLATRPAFAWTEVRESTGSTHVIRRARLGGHVRIELERPWYQTGDGERLAVVVSSDGRPSIEAGAFVTQAGRDPIWDTASPPRWPTRDLFAGTVDDRGDTARLEELGARVDLVTYEPWFHGDRWYVDVVMPRLAASSYSPLVQLAVGRYQAHSLDDPAATPPVDLRLSRVVKTAIVSLLPERTLTIARTNARVEVRLDGLGPGGPRQNRVDVVLEHVSVPAGAAAGNFELTSFEGDGSDPVSWRAVPGQSRPAALGTNVAVDLPAGLGPFRIRVREVELVGTVGPENVAPGALGELSERTVFADTVLVPNI